MQKYIVQCRMSFQFISRDAEGFFCLQPFLMMAHRFESGEDASLAAFEFCSDGFYIFTYLK